MSVNPNIKILLVEDAATMRKMELKILNTLGFNNIVESGDGKDAITKLKKDDQIELIIADWNMPEMDGYELLLWVRKSEHHNSGMVHARIH